MTKTNMGLSEILAKHDQGNYLRTIAEAVLQMIMEADVEGLRVMPPNRNRHSPADLIRRRTSSRPAGPCQRPLCAISMTTAKTYISWCLP